jgi:hypothetical protein
MAKFKRLLTEEQLNAIAVGRVQGESLRGIARSTGIPYETVRDASKRPDVVKVVESVQADIAADAQRTTDAVREKRKRETSRKSSATARAKAAAPKRTYADRAHPVSSGARRSVLDLEPFSDEWYDWYADRRLRSEIDMLNDNDAHSGIVPPRERRARARAPQP